MGIVYTSYYNYQIHTVNSTGVQTNSKVLKQNAFEINKLISFYV